MIKALISFMLVVTLITGIYSCSAITGNSQSLAEEAEEPSGAEYDPVLRRSEPFTGKGAPLYDPLKEEEIESWENPLQTEEMESKPLFQQRDRGSQSNYPPHFTYCVEAYGN